MAHDTKLFCIASLLFFMSCATSMSPMQVTNTLPSLTKSKYISQAQAKELTKTGKCKYLVRNRSYAAPLGLSPKGDLKYGARGIDEWVKLDGGNAYVLKNFKWITLDQSGATQLHLEFDTMFCE